MCTSTGNSWVDALTLNWAPFVEDGLKSMKPKIPKMPATPPAPDSPVVKLMKLQAPAGQEEDQRSAIRLGLSQLMIPRSGMNTIQ